VLRQSGGMFVQSEKFIEAHGGKMGDVSIYGQEANPTTWRLAAMNLAIRGIDFNLGREPADTFTRNQHPDLRADYILANPPFNISDWWHGSLEGDPRWEFGDPPQGNANYAWLQHMLHHLKPTGRAGIVLANGSMSSSQNNEGVIRAAMVDADVVEVMVALPGQLFFNTQIPACLWFLAKQKRRAQRRSAVHRRPQARPHDQPRAGELTDAVIARIAATVAAWRGEVDGKSLSPRRGQVRAMKTPTSPASAAACPWPRSPSTAMCSPPAATWARKKWKTTTKPLPTRCKSSPKSWASRWPRARSWMR
jgi:type I restriction enzyme M protein